MAVLINGVQSSAPSGAAGGELGGTYPNPTVDATHSGTAHHTAFVQADHDALANPHHANTTLAHGASSHDDRTRKFSFSPGDFMDNNAATTSRANGVNGQDVLTYADAAREAGNLSFTLPSDAVAGVPTFVRLISHQATTGNVVWEVTALVLAAGQSLGDTGTTTSTVRSESAVPDYSIEVFTQTFPISLSADNRVRLSVGRDGASGSDTLVGNVDDVLVELAYTADM